MKKTILLSLLILTNLIGFSQKSYLGEITKPVNLREGPSTEHTIIKTLKQGTQIFIISTDLENNYYNIIDIETNTEGFVYKSYVKIGKLQEKNEGGIFTPNGKTATHNPEIKIHNDTSITLTLKLNSQRYTFNPQETKTISLTSGTYDYRASAPNVIPDYGTEMLANNMSYSWSFYIVTQRN